MKKIALWLALIPATLFASTPFNDIIKEIESNNPALAADRAAAIADISNRKADNILDATEIGFDYAWGAPDGKETKMSASISQGFDWPGAYAARRNAIHAAQQSASAKFEAARRALQLNACNAIFKVIDANRRCEFLQNLALNLDSIQRQITSLMKLNQATELDFRKASLAIIDVRQQYDAAELARAESLATLAALNGGNLPAQVTDLNSYPNQPLLPLTSYINQGSANAYAARLDAATSQLDAKAAKMGLFPGFSLGYVFIREGGINFNGFSVGIKLPQYSANAQAKAAILQAQAMELLAQSEEAARNAEITAAYSTIENTAKRIEEYNAAFGENYFQLLQTLFNAKQITFIEYFNELSFFLNQKLNLFSQELQYQTLLSTLQNR